MFARILPEQMHAPNCKISVLVFPITNRRMDIRQLGSIPAATDFPHQADSRKYINCRLYSFFQYGSADTRAAALKIEITSE
jgi:hypothetical protein